MRPKAIEFVITALFVSMVSGQPAAEENLDRVFHFTHAETAKDVQEIAMVIRAMTDIPQPSVDFAQRTLAVRGKAGQVALAEWLFYELDSPANPQTLAPPSPTSATREYRLSDGGDNVVRVFYLTQTKTPQDLQEVATLVRSTADIRRLFTYTSARGMVLRGTAGQIALAEWLIHDLDHPASPQAPAPPSPNSATHEYRLSGGGEDVARVFYLRYTAGPQDLQEVATLVRSLGDIRRLFIYNAPRAVVLRGTAGQAALAEWLIHELDKPASPQAPGQPSQIPAGHEYRLAGSADDVARVYYLTHAETPQRVQEIATQVRSTAGIPRLFTYNALRAVALRGTAAQIAVADRLIRERDR